MFNTIIDTGYNPSTNVCQDDDVSRKLRQEVGLCGIFTIGLPANIIGSFFKSYSTNVTMEYLTPDFFEKKTFFEDDQGIRIFLISTSKLTVARVVGVVVSYPFQVLMIRQMSQFINGTRLYDFMFNAFPTILETEGFLSFFSGLTPRLIGEVITVWLTACLAYIFNKYIFADRIDPSLKKHTPYVTETQNFFCTLC
ncbi:Mitochondrial carrier like [Schistosoma japonicum]|nr:Mitochondrial carrier like [Schistosoma japonicum]